MHNHAIKHFVDFLQLNAIKRLGKNIARVLYWKQDTVRHTNSGTLVVAIIQDTCLNVKSVSVN